MLPAGLICFLMLSFSIRPYYLTALYSCYGSWVWWVKKNDFRQLSGHGAATMDGPAGRKHWTTSEGKLCLPDGKSLFYVEFSGEVTRVPVDGSGSTFRAGAHESFARSNPPNPGGRHVSIHPDGTRLLHIGGESAADETGYLRLVTDWERGLAK